MTSSKNSKPKSRLSPLTLVNFFLVGVLFVFFLPSFTPWNLIPKAADKTVFELLSAYRHPPIPVVSSKITPALEAVSFILLDSDTNTILTSRLPQSRIYPASITKLATAVTALNVYPLDEIVSVGSTYSEGKIMELKQGEQISVKNLVSALLVYSANDAAFVLADHHRSGIPGFIEEMNLLAKKYNLSNTNFVNFDGIHSPSHYSTVYDLAQMGRIALKNPVIRSVVREKELVVTDTSEKYIHKLTSTNELLGIIPEIEGLKTGYTIEAGGCFVSLINLNGHYLIGVVAASPDRFADTKKLLYWARSNVSWQPYSP